MPIDYSKLPRNDMIIVDMKSFYASVECVCRGLDPLETYLAVVGDLERSGSVVLAASPKMKKEFGIKTGSRQYEIPQDPRIHVVAARMGLYLDFSMSITRVLHQFAPAEDIHVYSVDEVWICANGLSRWYGTVHDVAVAIQERIQTEFRLPCALGIGPNKFISKAILDVRGKKEGIASCTYEEVPEKLWPVPVQEIWGIGPRLRKHLNRMGIYVLGELANYPIDRLRKKFGIMGEQLWNHANGIDLSEVNVKSGYNEHKGFSSGITLLRDYHISEVSNPILDLLDEIAVRLRRFHMAARTVSNSKDTVTEGFNRSRTLDGPTNDPLKLHAICLELFRRNAVDLPVRHLHVSVSQLVPDDRVQYTLFDDPEAEEKRQRAYAVMDEVRKKHGGKALFRASSLTKSGIAIDRSTRIGGHFA